MFTRIGILPYLRDVLYLSSFSFLNSRLLKTLSSYFLLLLCHNIELESFIEVLLLAFGISLILTSCFKFHKLFLPN